MKIAFLDRDGTLIYEPPDTKQVDSLDRLRILPGVIDGLKKLKQDGYELVLVSNQNGIGTSQFPLENFKIPQEKFLSILKDEGIEFLKVFICPHLQSDNCPCRKPKTGMVDDFLKNNSIDSEKSFFIGDRLTDMECAQNMGISGFKMETNSAFPRIGIMERVTNETDVFTAINLDGSGKFQIDTGLNFLNHVLEQFSKHSLIDVILKVKGDLKIDEHHTVEDTALTLGTALSKALGERKGIRRYGFLLPMDDTLVEVALDLGGRPYFVFNGDFKREKVGDLPTEMVEHFFRSLSDTLKVNIHIRVRYSRNEHHKIEGMFKAFAKAMRMACDYDPRLGNNLPSTKGIL